MKLQVQERLPDKSNKMGVDGRLRCHRCGSTMVYEKYYGFEEQFWGWRCIWCGNIVDQVILENRESMAVGAPRL
jgi:DNA-directed RNA polymerase subunit RPC12/RpoP